MQRTSNLANGQPLNFEGKLRKEEVIGREKTVDWQENLKVERRPLKKLAEVSAESTVCPLLQARRTDDSSRGVFNC